ncbi:MAG: adenylate/guanylate cyclase domain-containing protein [Gemmobacter sp.]
MLVGPYAGLQSYISCLLATPLLIFARVEGRLLVIAYTIVIACIVGGEILALRNGSMLKITEEARRIAYLSNVASSSVFVAYLLYIYSRSSIRNYLKLVTERQKSQQMLYDLMPGPIADRMIRGEPIIAESRGDGAVLFADIVGSSNLANHLSPIHLVEVLNGIFSDIDQACELHGVEKIKTIGDCYMAATGVFPEQSRLEGLIRLGLSIIEIVGNWSAKTGHPLAVRVGISTGQVVTGVIGRKRPLFDVWGQTVNAASAMEAHCDTNRVLVSEATHWRVRELFDFEPARTINAKGGQLLTAYLLVGPKSAT